MSTPVEHFKHSGYAVSIIKNLPSQFSLIKFYKTPNELTYKIIMVLDVSFPSLLQKNVTARRDNQIVTLIFLAQIETDGITSPV